jgi:hypothetical protein
MRRSTTVLLAVFAIAIAFGAYAQTEVTPLRDTCADGDAFVADLFSSVIVKPNATEPSIQWERLDNPNPSSPRLTLTWSPAKQKNVFRAAADRFWNHTPAPMPAPVQQPSAVITSAASVFSIDPNLANPQTHRAFARGFAVAQLTDPHVAQDAADLSLSYVDPRSLSSLNATWETPWWGLMLSGTFHYITGEAAAGQADFRVGKSFTAAAKRVTVFAECTNCTSRTT